MSKIIARKAHIARDPLRTAAASRRRREKRFAISNFGRGFQVV